MRIIVLLRIVVLIYGVVYYDACYNNAIMRVMALFFT